MRAELQDEIDRLRSRGITPGLAAVLVGDSPASATYVRLKGKACDEAGPYYETIRVKPEATQAHPPGLVQRAEPRHKNHGVLVPRPLAEHHHAPRGRHPEPPR